MTDITFGDAGAIITEELREETRSQFVDGQNNLTFQVIQRAHRHLEERAGQLDYRGVEDIINSLELVDTQERGNTLAIRFGWTHPQAERYEWGTVPHTIQGNPILAFIWEDRHNPPQWVKEQFDQGRDPRGRFKSGWRVFLHEVDVSGIEELRWARDALDWLARELS